MITVVRTAPLLTVQDRGRFGHFAAGVTRSGPLDALALDVANALVGNSDDAAALEGCLGGAEFRCDTDGTIAFAGAEIAVTRNGAPLTAYVACDVRAGDAIVVDRLVRGAVWYLAVRGGFDVPVVLGSRATLLPAELGGIDGKPVRNGAQLGAVPANRKRAALRRVVPSELRTPLDESPIPLLAAPRTDALTEDDWSAFYGGAFTVSRSSSRVGYRLEGTRVSPRLPADIASEPACAGAMQLPPEGNPIVLMADHPTIGGYPIIGVVPAFALGQLAQRVPGASVRFTPMSLDHASAAFTRSRETLSNWVSLG